MSAVTQPVTRPEGRTPSTAYAIVHWRGTLVRLVAAPILPSVQRSTPKLVTALSARTSARARLNLDYAEYGAGRKTQAAMAASALVPGPAWVPPGAPAWLAWESLDAALDALAAGLVAEAQAAGMTLHTRWRIQAVEAAGRFLDAREGPNRPALLAGPGSVEQTQRMAGRIAAAGLLAGVLAHGGRVVVFRTEAITLLALGDGFDVTATADGDAVARRIILGKRKG